MKLALEAFGEIEWSNNSQWQSDRAKVAITAIKEALAQPEQEPRIDIYRSFEQWKSGNVLEHGVPRTEFYTKADLDLVEMGWRYGYDAGRAVEQALDKKAENAKALGLDYEPAPENFMDALKFDVAMREYVMEPVAYLCENAVGHKYFRWKKPSSTYKPIALYTAPPQRPWVGLTLERKMDMAESYFTDEWAINRAIQLLSGCENALKEENGA